jgi:hypothetical protein
VSLLSLQQDHNSRAKRLNSPIGNIPFKNQSQCFSLIASTPFNLPNCQLSLDVCFLPLTSGDVPSHYHLYFCAGDIQDYHRAFVTQSMGHSEPSTHQHTMKDEW